jgi:hypothetical protein
MSAFEVVGRKFSDVLPTLRPACPALAVLQLRPVELVIKLRGNVRLAPSLLHRQFKRLPINLLHCPDSIS